MELCLSSERFVILKADFHVLWILGKVELDSAYKFGRHAVKVGGLLKCGGTSWAALFSLVVGSAASANAQMGTSSAETNAESKSVPVTANEIIVTAQRRSERLQDVPISITAFDKNEIEKRGINTVLDVAGATPNLQIKAPQGYGKPTIFIRGMGFNDFNASAVGAVGIYNDEIFIGGSSNQLFQTFDMERIEVLRGPQGTLYGRNTTGGAINFISRKPTEKAEASASLTYGRFNQVEAEAAVSGALIEEKLSARIAGVFGRRSGSEVNLFDSTNTGRYEKWAGRLLLNIAPVGNVDFLLNVHAGQTKGDGKPIHNEGLLPGGVDLFGYKEGSDFYAGSYNTDLYGRVKSFGASLRSTFVFDSFDVVAISAYEEVTSDGVADADASPMDFLTLIRHDRQDQFSQEVRLNSNDGGALEWILGAYYYTEDLNAESIYDLGRFLRDMGQTPNPADPNAPLIIAQPFDQKTTSYALFGQSTYAISGQLKLNIGLRYTWDKKSIDFQTFADEPSLGFAPIIPQFYVDRKWNALTGRAALDFQITDDAMVYASYNRGYKGGGFNGGALFDLAETAPFNPEKVDAYEVGFKTSWMDGRLILNGSAFYNDFSDLQVFRFVASGVGLPITLIANAASATIKGGEVEIAFIPVDRLRVDMGVGYLDATYDTFFTLSPSPGGGFSEVNLSGNRLVAAPKLSFSGSAEYGFEVSDGLVVTPRAEWSYRSKQFFDTSNDPLLSQEGYWLANASLRLETDDSSWAVSVWGNNVFGKKYNMDKISLANFGINQVSRGERASYGITLRARY